MPIKFGKKRTMEIVDLKQFNIFNNVDSQSLETIIDVHDLVEYEIGEHLISRFKTNEFVYLLLEGEAKVYLKEGGEPLNTLYSGDSMGEISVLDGYPGSAFVIATKPSKVIKISREKIWRLTESNHAFTKNLLQILVNYIRLANDQVDYSIQLQHKIAAKANRDALTGLYNRRWFDEQFDGLLRRSIEKKQDFSFIMIDIDRFKQVNDDYGHGVGDLVLQQTGLILSQHARTQDAAVRYGGEEMSLILPNTSLEQAINIAERLRKAIAETEFILTDNSSIHVTISLGCSTYTGTEGKQQLMKIADDALYLAKKNGRNQVRY